MNLKQLSKEEQRELKQLKNFFKFSIIKKIFSIPAQAIKKFFLWLWSGIIYIYYYLYYHVVTFKKWIKYILVLITATMTVLFCINDYDERYIIYLLSVMLVYGILYGIIKIYYELFGIDIINQYEEQLSTLFIEKKIPHIAKFFGPTGVGKDSTGAAITQKVATMLARTLSEEIEDLKKRLYMINFRYVDIHLDLQFLNYINQKLDIKREYFTHILELNNCFFYNQFLRKWNTQDILTDWKLWQKDIKGYKSELVFDDLVNPKHYIEMLFDYCCKWTRYNKVMNYVLSNQPFLERPGLAALVWSFDFSKTKSGPPLQVGVGPDKQYFAERIFFPFVERLVVYETEVGAYYYNKDNEMRKEVFDGGVRNSKAFNRHLYGEHYYHFQFDQKANRSLKELRDLDHAYIGIIDRRMFPGGKKRIWILDIFKSIINFFSTKEVTDKYNDILTLKKEEHVDRYRRMYDITKNKKYEKKFNDIINTNYRDYTSFSLKIDKLNTKIESLKARLKNQGYIKVQLSISDNEDSSSATIFTLRELLSKDKPLWNLSYRTELTFKIVDCYGHYDTHFLKAAGYNRAAASEINILDVPPWPLSLNLNKQIMLYMGYPNSYGMFGITHHDIREAKYQVKPLSKEQLAFYKNK